MIIGLFGESCTGKSSIAASLAKAMNAKVYTGKDYLKLAKSETDAKSLFCERLNAASTGPENIIYVITEKEHLSLLPETALRVLVTADLDVIKQRFAQRMNGTLPAPIAAMLEKKHHSFDSEPHQLHITNGLEGVELILQWCGQ